MTTIDIVQKLWNLCNILRDDGITYHQYVSELTYLLFLKMALETGTEERLVEGHRWADLTSRTGVEQLNHYRDTLNQLGSRGRGIVQAIYANASTSLKKPTNLGELIRQIDQIDWYSAREEGLGDLYEGLLEKNASEKKSGAGQYFTPRPLIDAIVAVTRPAPGEIIQDPAAGTGGFLIAADRHIRKQTEDFHDLSAKQQDFQLHKAITGIELVQDTHRLCLMNLMLHKIEGDVRMGDTLSNDGTLLPQADLVLSNPPFGTKKGGGLPSRDDFTFRTSNKQFAFLQHIYRGLRPASGNKPGGRAAVVLPDNVLFEENIGAEIRADLMRKTNLHTILRLPTGIFYAQGVKTNVLFFHAATEASATRDLWVYDMRANMPSFGKRTALTFDHFRDFIDAHGPDPLGASPRVDQGPSGRFRRFSRDDLRARGDNLDISWLKDDSALSSDELPQPDEIADQILSLLRSASSEIQALKDALGGDA